MIKNAIPRGQINFWNDREFWYAEFAAFAIRVLFLVATAGLLKSSDVYAWINVGKTLFSGGNPYALTSQLNYAPFWMQVIYLLQKFSVVTDLSFVTCLILLLIMIDLALVAALFALLQILVPDRSSGRFVLWAFSLNPICIILTCQHGNFDGLVALTVVLFLIAIVNYQKSRDPVNWLLACVLLGIAILIKTIPLLLAPLLLIGIKNISRKILLFGGALTIAPMILGLSIIYVLSPIGVRTNVFAYRSIAGYFGFTGLLSLFDLPAFIAVYARVFPIVIAISMLGLAYWFYKFPEEPARKADRTSVFAAAALMLALPLFGPGYGSQYLFWSIPLLSATYYLISDSTLQRTFLFAYLIAIITYAVEYSFFLSHGSLAVQLWPDSALMKLVAAKISIAGNQTLIRMPMFIALIAVFYMTLRGARKVGLSTT